ncbi:MAG: arylsulfotransferase family protein [Albidovulum sp.]|uniref:arylsulfotransferase family protein n=1 Tax=Albidovulum sp. TaxID=1872424 RepID=UPI003C80D468
MARIIGAVAIAFLLFMLGMVLGIKSLPPAKQLQDVIASAGQMKSLAVAAFKSRPDQHLSRRWYPDDGVTIADTDRMAPGVTFVSGLFGQRLGFRLFGADGQVLYDWPIDFFQIAPEKMQHRYHALIHGALLYPNGDVVANLDGRGMVRFDACGRIKWMNEDRSHHSIFADETGTLWAPIGVADYNNRAFANTTIRLDRIASFDPETGQKLSEIDLVDAIEASDMIGLIQDYYRLKDDVVHLNDVEVLSAELAPAFPMFRAGDLLLSLRNLNQLWVLDGKTHAIKWVSAGATLGQHDPDFEPDGTISVLDNRPLAPITAPDGYPGAHGGSRILAIDPAIGTHETLYRTDARNTFYTPYRGKHQKLPNGNLLIAETDAGRAFEVTPAGEVVWSFVNGWDAETVGWVLDIGRYPAQYGDFAGQSCN